jgi:hypothetical protein
MKLKVRINTSPPLLLAGWAAASLARGCVHAHRRAEAVSRIPGGLRARPATLSVTPLYLHGHAQLMLMRSLVARRDERITERTNVMHSAMFRHRCEPIAVAFCFLALSCPSCLAARRTHAPPPPPFASAANLASGAGFAGKRHKQAASAIAVCLFRVCACCLSTRQLRRIRV